MRRPTSLPQLSLTPKSMRLVRTTPLAPPCRCSCQALGDDLCVLCGGSVLSFFDKTNPSAFLFVLFCQSPANPAYCPAPARSSSRQLRLRRARLIFAYPDACTQRVMRTQFAVFCTGYCACANSYLLCPSIRISPHTISASLQPLRKYVASRPARSSGKWRNQRFKFLVYYQCTPHKIILPSAFLAFPAPSAGRFHLTFFSSLSSHRGQSVRDATS